MHSKLVSAFGLALVFVVCGVVAGQQPAPPPPSPSPTPDAREGQEPVKVFTEEVRLPVVALDQFGHYDPTLVADDILVLEDGQPQQIRSVRHLPANVLIVLDTGGEVSGLGGTSKKTNLTRQVAMQLVKGLHEGEWVSVMQFNNRVEVLQPWTVDRDSTLKILKTKVSSGKRDVFSDALIAAAQQIQARPEGSRHIILITDGVDTAGVKSDRAKATTALMAARATVHIISYTEFVRQKNTKKKSDISVGQRPSSQDPLTVYDPTLPPGTTRNPVYGVSIRFDPAMRRLRKAYETDVKKSQQTLTSLADETGGTIFLPKTDDEMLSEADKVTRDIGSDYVITYRPTRALAEARPNEYRKVQVASRRVGLTLRSRRGYVVSAGGN
ncbi:MAG TPA: VWA domain-containing protein [Pyrinomonadaceae bacterium]|nr:VWA domain-containing protein [Pyrinomonadaceae bacterium]